MLAVSLDETAVQPWLDDEIALAAVNSPAACVLAGPPEAITALQCRLAAADIACRPVEAGRRVSSGCADRTDINAI